jgi:8-oxo-dGTP pyrophosphatase MutT (NUDIX family)
VTTRERLRDQLITIVGVDERERTSVASTLDRLTWPGDPFDPKVNDHHVTASAFVVSSRGVILLCHRLLGIWVQPGGHVDAGEGPERAAVRETLEETGLVVQHVTPVTIFHVDVHPGPHGHTHYDLRYLLVAPPLDPVPHEGESAEVYWFDFDSAIKRCEPSLVNALVKLSQRADLWNVKD